ncbi:MAG: SIMPL domain-containing protein [Candidatus Cloacimonadaceae bacterium]|nr:SIMPL domain-containing protein [Candidatus Cloacimonadaceae bacterium]MDP3113767.1 SIMPL domain-containing protein [Candidatus Cloacimonadaceae bacterium]
MPLNILLFTLAAVLIFIVPDHLRKSKSTTSAPSVIAVGFIIGMILIGYFYLQGKKVDDGLRVTGYSSKLFESDLVKWRLGVQKNTDLGNLKSAYNTLAKDVADFKQQLLDKGLAESDINIQPPTSQPTFDNYGNITSYNVNQLIYVLSSDITKVEAIALNPDFFADRGLLLQQSNLEFLYSKLPDLKKQLIAEATADALARAKEIVGSAKSKLGNLKSARAGVFQITEPYSTDVSDFGFYNTSTRSKSISVTVNTEFELR